MIVWFFPFHRSIFLFTWAWGPLPWIYRLHCWPLIFMASNPRILARLFVSSWNPSHWPGGLDPDQGRSGHAPCACCALNLHTDGHLPTTQQRMYGRAKPGSACSFAANQDALSRWLGVLTLTKRAWSQPGAAVRDHSAATCASAEIHGRIPLLSMPACHDPPASMMILALQLKARLYQPVTLSECQL